MAIAVWKGEMMQKIHNATSHIIECICMQLSTEGHFISEFSK